MIESVPWFNLLYRGLGVRNRGDISSALGRKKNGQNWDNWGGQRAGCVWCGGRLFREDVSTHKREKWCGGRQLREESWGRSRHEVSARCRNVIRHSLLACCEPRNIRPLHPRGNHSSGFEESCFRVPWCEGWPTGLSE